MSIVAQDTLSYAERAALSRYENTIRAGLKSFVDVWNALACIRRLRLYRRGFATFEDYCRVTWGLSDAQVNRMIKAAQVIENLTPIGVNPEGEPPSLPANEAQARPLAALEPSQQREAWKRANEAPGPITAAKVEAAVEEIMRTAVVDGTEWGESARFIMDLADRTVVDVDYRPSDMASADHFEFHGEITGTGYCSQFVAARGDLLSDTEEGELYRSQFPTPRAYALHVAECLRVRFLKEQRPEPLSPAKGKELPFPVGSRLLNEKGGEIWILDGWDATVAGSLVLHLEDNPESHWRAQPAILRQKCVLASGTAQSTEAGAQSVEAVTQTPAIHSVETPDLARFEAAQAGYQRKIHEQRMTMSHMEKRIEALVAMVNDLKEQTAWQDLPAVRLPESTLKSAKEQAALEGYGSDVARWLREVLIEPRVHDAKIGVRGARHANG